MEHLVQLLAASVVLAVVFFLVLKHYKTIFVTALGVVGIGVLLVAVGGVIAVGVYLYELNVERQCMTAHERQAKASAARDDYFGRRLRDEAAQEAKRCKDLASRREAAASATT